MERAVSFFKLWLLTFPDALPSDPKLILDADGRIIAILLGTPEDPDWPSVVAEALKDMARARRYARQYGWNPSVHRRGRYLSLTTGVSFGGGQRVRPLSLIKFCVPHPHLTQRPGNLVNSRFFRRLIRRLLRNKAIRRLAGFQSSRSPFLI